MEIIINVNNYGLVTGFRKSTSRIGKMFMLQNEHLMKCSNNDFSRMSNIFNKGIKIFFVDDNVNFVIRRESDLYKQYNNGNKYITTDENSNISFVDELETVEYFRLCYRIVDDLHNLLSNVNIGGIVYDYNTFATTLSLSNICNQQITIGEKIILPNEFPQLSGKMLALKELGGELIQYYTEIIRVGELQETVEQTEQYWNNQRELLKIYKNLI